MEWHQHLYSFTLTKFEACSRPLSGSAIKSIRTSTDRYSRKNSGAGNSNGKSVGIFTGSIFEKQNFNYKDIESRKRADLNHVSNQM
jgi:hypothetical protein